MITTKGNILVQSGMSDAQMRDLNAKRADVFARLRAIGVEVSGDTRDALNFTIPEGKEKEAYDIYKELLPSGEFGIFSTPLWDVEKEQEQPAQHRTRTQKQKTPKELKEEIRKLKKDIRYMCALSSDLQERIKKLTSYVHKQGFLHSADPQKLRVAQLADEIHHEGHNSNQLHQALCGVSRKKAAETPATPAGAKTQSEEESNSR